MHYYEVELRELTYEADGTGVHALRGLDPSAEEMFDDAYWRIDPGDL